MEQLGGSNMFIPLNGQGKAPGKGLRKSMLKTHDGLEPPPRARTER